MKKNFFIILALFLFSGCNSIAPNYNQVVAPQQNNEISFYTSDDAYTKYCNGVDMNSEGYKNSLTKIQTISIGGILTREDIIGIAVIQASKKANLTTITAMESDFLKIIGDIAYIRPIEGWAGVSIFLCAWKPLVEVNLLQFPEIKKVEWVNDLNAWNNLK